MTDHTAACGSAANELPLRAELARKLIHLFALIIPLGMVMLPHSWAATLLAAGAALGVGGDVLRVRSAWFASLIYRIFGSLMRADEKPPLGTRPVLNGATWVLLSALLLILLFTPFVAAVSFAIFMIADAAAALVGRRYGTRRWPWGDRTLTGSSAFVGVGFVVGVLLPSVTAPKALVLAVVGAFAESLPYPSNDNLRAPLIMACTLVALQYILNDTVELLPLFL